MSVTTVELSANPIVMEGHVSEGAFNGSNIPASPISGLPTQLKQFAKAAEETVGPLIDQYKDHIEYEMFADEAEAEIEDELKIDRATA